MSLAKVNEAYEAYQEAVRNKNRDKREKVKSVLDAIELKFPEGYSYKRVSKEVFEADEDVKKLREIYNNSIKYHDLTEYKDYLAVRNEEIYKRYVYKASNGILTQAAIEDIANELSLDRKIVQVAINKFNRNKIPRFKYVIINIKTKASYYCSDLEDVKDFCLNYKLDYQAILNNYGDYFYQKIPELTFKKLNRGLNFVYEGYTYTKTSNNFFACL